MIRLLTLLAALALPLQAEDVSISRNHASELYVALASSESGLSPANVVAVADNINALRAQVEAYDKGKLAFQRAVRQFSKTNAPDAEARLEKMALELEAKGEEVFAVTLVPVNLTDEEIVASKIKPANLAVIRRWLRTKK